MYYCLPVDVLFPTSLAIFEWFLFEWVEQFAAFCVAGCFICGIGVLKTLNPNRLGAFHSRMRRWLHVSLLRVAAGFVLVLAC